MDNVPNAKGFPGTLEELLQLSVHVRDQAYNIKQKLAGSEPKRESDVLHPVTDGMIGQLREIILTLSHAAEEQHATETILGIAAGQAGQPAQRPPR